MEHMFKVCRPDLVVCDSKLVKDVDEALTNIQNNAKIVVLNSNEDTKRSCRFIKYEDMSSEEVDLDKIEVEEVEDPRSDLAFIICSSGTTGLPKGIGLTHHNLNCQLTTIEDLPPEVSNNVYLELTQFYWISGVFALLIVSITGTKKVFIPKFNEIQLFQAIQKYKANWIVLSPAELASLLSHPDFDNYDLSSIMMIATAGAPLTQGVYNLLRSKLGEKVGVTQAYGLTETTATVTIPDVKNASNNIGKLAAGVQCKVVSLKTGASLGPMEEGELCFRGPMLMKGYVNNKTATEQIIDKDGWLHTGDLGYYDEDKKFHIVDRIKEFIKYRTWQVPPAELEALISTLPGVQEVAVTGIPHPLDINHPMALVVKSPGAQITEEQVKSIVKEKLSDHKQLRAGVKFVDSLPKTLVGKVKRREVGELAKKLVNQTNG